MIAAMPHAVYRCIASAMLVLPAVGCSKPFVPATRCLLMDVRPEDAGVAFAVLDEFAATNRFSSDWADPNGRLYTLTDGSRSVSTIHYREGMSEHGAELTYYQYDETRGAAGLSAFDKVVADKLATRPGVRKCSDVPGYVVPSSSQ